MASPHAPSLFADDATRVVQVALPIPAHQLFDYAVPPALLGDAQIGCRVRVGLQRRRAVGVIVAEGAQPENKRAKLRAIEAVLDDAPVLGATLLEALCAEAESVLCPVGLALHAALPPDSVPHLRLAYELTPGANAAGASAPAKGARATPASARARGKSASADSASAHTNANANGADATAADANATNAGADADADTTVASADLDATTSGAGVNATAADANPTAAAADADVDTTTAAADAGADATAAAADADTDATAAGADANACEFDAHARAVLAALVSGARTRAELRSARGTHGMSARTLTATLAALETRGAIRSVQVTRARRAATNEFVKPRAGLDLARACKTELARAPKQAALLREIAARGEVPHRALTKRPGAAAALRNLRTRGFVQIEARSHALENALPHEQPKPQLTPEQDVAVRALARAVRSKSREAFLLQGVTGSGKTEVYLHAVDAALKTGRQAIVLVPEITLTHQILGRLRARFGDRLAVLHSGLKPGERLSEWNRLRRGETPIAVGARSALFAPMRDLGVIVLDEEHDGAYKNEEGFRYHARRFARRRSQLDGCPLVLGSATPSLEVRYAAERGRVRHLRLEHRTSGQPLPAVNIVDLTQHRAALPRGRKLILTGPLLRALRETLADRAQAILFLNRRGFSTQITCFECGHVCRCKHCDIALTFHAAAQRLRCHYCDFQQPPPARCPKCAAPDTALLGIGTERLEEEVRSAFPGARIARLDRDTASRRGATEGVLRALQSGALDILVGTQMVAKGHDFPGVRLVGIVNGDLGLHLPDFRAAERCFQLLTQVAGRAGRSGAPGRVVLQTWSPDHYAIRPVATHDYEQFYREEIAQRAALGYPPLGQLGLLRISSEDEALARRCAQQLAERVRAGCEGNQTTTGDAARVFAPAGGEAPPLSNRRDATDDTAHIFAPAGGEAPSSAGKRAATGDAARVFASANGEAPLLADKRAATDDAARAFTPAGDEAPPLANKRAAAGDAARTFTPAGGEAPPLANKRAAAGDAARVFAPARGEAPPLAKRRRATGDAMLPFALARGEARPPARRRDAAGDALRAFAFAGGEVLGPAPSPIAKLRGRYRFQVLLRHPKAAGVRAMLRLAEAGCAGLPSALRVTLDANPYDML